jgi:hypothetical protein
MPPAGFETTISEGERPQTYILDRTATGIGKTSCLVTQIRTADLTVKLVYLIKRNTAKV